MVNVYIDVDSLVAMHVDFFPGETAVLLDMYVSFRRESGYIYS